MVRGNTLEQESRVNHNTGEHQWDFFYFSFSILENLSTFHKGSSEEEEEEDRKLGAAKTCYLLLLDFTEVWCQKLFFTTRKTDFFS